LIEHQPITSQLIAAINTMLTNHRALNTTPANHMSHLIISINTLLANNRSVYTTAANHRPTCIW